MADLFWNIVTSYPVLGFIGLVLLAATIVGYFPLLKWVPVIGPYVEVGKLVTLFAAGSLCFLIGFRISDERALASSLRAKLEATSIDLEAATDAVNQSEAARQELAQQAQADQERIAKYETALKASPNLSCNLTDDDLRWLRDDGNKPR